MPENTSEETSPYAATKKPAKVRTVHLQQWKADGTTWAMLTTYDQMTAEIFDEAGIPVFLVGDSAANNVLAYDTTLGVTMDEMITMTRSVTRATKRALVVADMPFGSYQVSPEKAVENAVRLMKEGNCHAVKLEGGTARVPAIEAITAAGIPVMAHLGFTPQSEHAVGGYRVAGRGGAAAEQLLADAVAVEAAGAFSLVLEMVPTPIASKITAELSIPTIGIGAGAECDAQVLVWQDFAGLRAGRMPRFVKQYANLRAELTRAATEFAADVADGSFPAPEHQFDE